MMLHDMSERRRLALRVVGGGFCVLLVVYSITHFIHTGMEGRAAMRPQCWGDFSLAFPAAFVKRYNPSLFEQFTQTNTGIRDPERDEGGWWYGPVLHGLTLPLTVLSSRATACLLWKLANLTFLTVSVVLLFRVLFASIRRARWAFAAVFTALWLNAYPLLEAFRQANIEIFELCLLMVAYRCFRAIATTATPARITPTELWGGVCLGTAIMTKFLPAIGLPYLLIKRRWKMLVTAVLTAGVIAVATQVTLDWRKSLTMQHLIVTRFPTRTHAHVQSLSGLVSRWFAEIPAGGLTRTVNPVIPAERQRLAVRVVRTSVVVALVAFGLLFWLRRASAAIELEWSLLLAFMIFVPPWNEDYYQMFLLVPLSVLLTYAWNAQRHRLGWWLLLAACYLSTGSIIVPSSWADAALGGEPFGFHRLLQNLSIPTLGNLAILCWCGVLYWRSEPRGLRL